MTNTIDRAPTRPGSYLALLSGLAVVLLALPYSGTAALVGSGGLALIGAATVGGWRGLVDLGGLVLALAVVTTGLQVPSSGVDPIAALVVLAAAVAAVVAWDVATNAIDMGEQLGRKSDTVRAEASHALATAIVGLLVAGGAYSVFRLSSGGQPVAALALLLLAMLVLVSALRL